MKIILDTNIWISFLLGKRLSILVDIFKKENISIFVSNHLLTEISTVACRPKFSSYITQEALNNLLELIKYRLEKADLALKEATDCRRQSPST